MGTRFASVDADQRKPQVADSLDIENRVGLTDVFPLTVELAEVLDTMLPMTDPDPPTPAAARKPAKS